MTLDQAKNQIAKNHDYPNWTNLLHDFYDGNSPAQFVEECEDEAMELYARSKWDECYQYCHDNSYDSVFPVKPEFKP
jgi:hypothetical protein